jgi:4-amino-4-deoxy-L-arabinose transferase-like glycosyltransferase
MRITVSRPTAESSKEEQASAWRLSLRTLLLSWEVYLIIAVAAFLRLYQLASTEFDDDEAVMYHMARNAVTHGFIPATSNIASIGIFNPPGTTNLLLLPALISGNPIWGVVLIAVLAILSVLLTYFFVRHYYGRLAGTIAALTYATVFRAVIYSRFIWNQNFLPFFVMLFFMALFRGAVGRKKGWFLAALVLLGFMVQLHASSALLIIPLALAFLLAPGTIRKRDWAIGLLVILVLYAPYLLWEAQIRLKDILAYLERKPESVFDLEAWHFYQAFLNPYSLLSEQNPLHWRIVPFIGEQSYLWKLAPYLAWVSRLLQGLVIASIGALLVWAIRSWNKVTADQENRKLPFWGQIARYWKDLRNSPERSGILILLSWQIIPLVLLLRHSSIYLHYFIFFMPGPFILLAVFLVKAVTWLRRQNISLVLKRSISYGVYGAASLIIAAQLIGSTAGILDLDRGHYSDGAVVNNLYNDLRSLQAAVNKADQLAQDRHLSRVYMSTDWPTQSTLRYLSTQMRTPATLFTDEGCIALPGADAGPAVMLIGPYSPFADALVQRFTNATLIDQPARPGGAPFRLYIVNAKPGDAEAVSQNTLGQDLRLLDRSLQPFQYQNTSWQVSRWKLLRSGEPSYRRIYSYTMTEFTDKRSSVRECKFTALHAGDQILVPFNNLSLGQSNAALNIKGTSYEVNPRNYRIGPLTFQTFKDEMSEPKRLLTPGGENVIRVVAAR